VGGGGGGGGGWVAGTLGLQKQWGTLPNGCNLRIGALLKTISLAIPAMPQSRNYNEVPVHKVCLYFCHNIHNLFRFFFCLASPKGRLPATQSITPPLNPPLETGSTNEGKRIFDCLDHTGSYDQQFAFPY